MEERKRRSGGEDSPPAEARVRSLLSSSYVYKALKKEEKEDKKRKKQLWVGGDECGMTRAADLPRRGQGKVTLRPEARGQRFPFRDSSAGEKSETCSFRRSLACVAVETSGRVGACDQAGLFCILNSGLNL